MFARAASQFHITIMTRKVIGVIRISLKYRFIRPESLSRCLFRFYLESEFILTFFFFYGQPAELADVFALLCLSEDVVTLLTHYLHQLVHLGTVAEGHKRLNF